MDKKKKKIKKVCNIILSLILCLFSAFSFAGCGGVGGGGTGNVDNDNNDETQNPGSGNGYLGGGGTQVPDKTSPLNKAFMGAIIVSTGGGKYYDKYLAGSDLTYGGETVRSDGFVSFDVLVDRQFETMASYIYDSLNYIYGTSNDHVVEIINYGDIKNFDIADTRNGAIGDAVQQDLCQLGVDVVNGQTSAIKYKDSMSGCDDIEVIYNTSGTTADYSFTYTNKKVKQTTWAHRLDGYFTKEQLKVNLIKLYNLIEKEGNPYKGIEYWANDPDPEDYEISFNLQGDSTIDRFIDYFSNTYRVSTLGESSEGAIAYIVGNVDKIGLSRAYLWHVGYYLAYTIIGADNFNASQAAYNEIFENSTTLKPLVSNIVVNQDNEVESSVDLTESFERYKGYDVVIGDLIDRMINMWVVTDKVIKTRGGSTTNASNTIFPLLSRVNYTWIDDLDLLSEACDEGFQDAEDPDPKKSEKWTDEDWDKYWYDYYKSDKCKSDPGSFYNLKQIILIPKKSNKFEGDQINLSGVLMGLCVNSSEYHDNYNLRMNVEATCEGVGYFRGVKYETYDGFETYLPDQNMITVTKNYRLFLNIIPVDFTIDDLNFGDVELKESNGGLKIEELIAQSFITRKVTIDYPNAGKVDAKYSSGTFEHGYLKVFNNSLFCSDGSLNLAKNYINLNFTFYDNLDQQVNPSVSLMFFSLYQ